MYRVIVSLLLASSVLVGCANFKSAPQYGSIHEITQKTDASCDATSNLEAVRNCVLELKNAYADRTVALDANRTSSGGLLIATAAVAAGGELFKRSRDITRSTGLLGGVISSANSFAPPVALANVLQNGRSQLECALVKSDQLLAELKAAEAKYQRMDRTYWDAENAIAKSELRSTSAGVQLLDHAVENMDRVCNATTMAELMDTPDGAIANTPRVVDEQAIAQQLYATAVSISDQVIYKYRGSYTDANDAVKQIDEAVTKVKAALAQAEAMTTAAKTVDEAANVVAPGVECDNGKPTADGASIAAKSGISNEDASTACAAKENAKEVEAAANDVANIALTAASLSACAGVQQP